MLNPELRDQHYPEPSAVHSKMSGINEYQNKASLLERRSQAQNQNDLLRVLSTVTQT